MRRRARWLLASCLGGLGAGSCGGDQPPVMLSAAGAWNADPSTVAETGYQVAADVGWPDRRQSCSPLSANLRIRINDVEATPMVTGDCRWDVRVTSGAFQQDLPITVQLVDRDQVLGEAHFEGLFPGAHARLVTPANGQQVRAGDSIVLTMPMPPVSGGTTYAEFYWLDTPATVPPFHTFANGTLSADGSMFQTTAPTMTGRAAVVLKTVFDVGPGPASSCSGFESCDAQPNTNTIGPVFVEVVP